MSARDDFMLASIVSMWLITCVAEQSIQTISETKLTSWATEIALSCDYTPGRRYIIGIAGIPGSGKSTFAARLLAHILKIKPGAARLIPMDGYHLPDAQLQQMGLQSRKGSPESFDAPGYIAMLQQAQLVDSKLHFPVYDRKQHAAVLRDDPMTMIDKNVRVIITEGNYLLLRSDPWQMLRHVLDECWFLHTDPDTARRWLLRRHMAGGRTEVEANKRYEHNDGPNTYEILSNSRSPDRVICWPPSEDKVKNQEPQKTSTPD